MRSSLYNGRVMHARSLPVRNRFSYPVYFYAFDIDELEEVDRTVLLFGHNRVRPVALHDRDYLTPGPGSLREKLRDLLARTGKQGPSGRVILVTSARVLHYVFNPVSFFFCYGLEGDLEQVIVQVNNTFGEMHVYPLDERLPGRREGEHHFRAEKVFHVSPFFDRVGHYDFYLRDITRQDMDIVIQYRQGEKIVFAARLSGTPVPLKRWTVAAKLLRHPFTASLTMPRILRQAARLRFARHLPVYHKPPPLSPLTIRPAPPGPLDRLGRRVLETFLSRITQGNLSVTFPEGNSRNFGREDGRNASLKVVDNRFFRRTLFGGGIGFGESFVAGEWTTEDISGTLALLADNLEVLKEKHHRLSALGRTVDYTRHLLKPNTRTGSRRNIQAHYDLRNEFFALFLDPTMTYSCGLYPAPDTSLEEAQRIKLRTIIDKARIRKEDHILEIGCGWGSFAVEAARITGCRVTGITISREQLKLARERIRENNLEGRVQLEMMDYRNVTGLFDRIVSIEMLEAVGHGNLGSWFALCDRVLKPGGLAVVQVITIPHERYGPYRRSSDWIRKHIFPGGHLPSRESLAEAAGKSSHLAITGVETIGPHYVRTLEDWNRNLREGRGEAAALGYSDAFLRKWEYYFAYCRAGFETGAIDDLQIVLEKPPGDAER